MASNCGSDIFYLITEKLLIPHGEHQGGPAPGPQALRGLSAFEDNRQSISSIGPYARTPSRRSLKRDC
jgi:hypothetical protein